MQVQTKKSLSRLDIEPERRRKVLISRAENGEI